MKRPEVREKMSQTRRERIANGMIVVTESQRVKTEEQCHKISRTLKQKGIRPPSRKGLPGPWSGRKRPGLRTSSQFQKGQIPWIKGRHHTAEVIEKLRTARLKQRIPTHLTIPEKKFLTMCRKNSLPFKFTGDGSFWIGRINPDFIDINGGKVAVDIFGTFWHSPLFNQRLRPSGELNTRRALAQEYGWKLIILWEDELYNESLVLSKLGGGV